MNCECKCTTKNMAEYLNQQIASMGLNNNSNQLDVLPLPSWDAGTSAKPNSAMVLNAKHPDLLVPPGLLDFDNEPDRQDSVTNADVLLPPQ